MHEYEDWYNLKRAKRVQSLVLVIVDCGDSGLASEAWADSSVLFSTL